MATLYVTSAETFSGKSALCIGLGVRLRADGFKAGYRLWVMDYATTPR